MSREAEIPRIYAGTSGWAYPTWKPGFYPAALSAKRFLEYYAEQLNSVEVNYSFRKLPSTEMLTSWLATVPAGFCFSFKAPQRITHFRRLVDCEREVSEFITALEPVRAAGKLGAFLFQLPPNFKANQDRLKVFLGLPAFKGPRRPRIAFEFRHESWFDEATYRLLRVHGAALCLAESEDLKTPNVQTARDFTYLRLRCCGGYSKRQVAVWAKTIAEMRSGRNVFAYFKHEAEPTGALNAVALTNTLKSGAFKR